MNLRWIFWFWGVMDLFYIVRFSYVNYAQGKIPLYSDIQSFLTIAPEHGMASVLFFLLAVALNLSIVVSAFLLLFRQRSALPFIYFQTPLRLFGVVPSLALLPWLINVNGLTSPILLFALLVVSEMIKLISLVFVRQAFTLGERGLRG
jgi:hypothetical protein